MFEDLYDEVSFLWSWKWPSVEGEVTDVLVEHLSPYQRNERYRLSVTYKFSIGDDGPYTGESFWNPSFASKRRTMAARHKFHVGEHVTIRYRRDDPSVNRLDRRTYEGTRSLTFLIG